MYNKIHVLVHGIGYHHKLTPQVYHLCFAMVETGKIFKAEECKQLGIVDELVPEGQDFAAAMEYAKMVAQRPSVAVDMPPRLIQMSQRATLDEILDYEGLAGVCVAASADAKEGTMAFMEKRKPVYRGI